MLLQRMTPLAGFGQLRREMDRLFGEFLPELNGALERSWGFPAVNVWEDGERMFVEAEVPGLSMKDLDVEVVGSELLLKGRREASGNEDVTYHRRERGVGEFARRISLPVDIDANQVEAALKDGVLTITLPKAEQAKVKRIEVKALE
ncbi:MAG: Hsp20/alpha crystallin family protein [Phycisphaerae bacterium]